MDDEEEHIWLKGLSVLRGNQFIAAVLASASAQSMAGMNRYVYLQRLEKKYDDWPHLLVLLAECHFMMQSTYGAYERMKKIQEIIGSGEDTVLDGAVRHLFSLKHLEDDEVLEGIEIKYYKRPVINDINLKFDTASVHKDWNNLMNQKGIRPLRCDNHN